MSTKTVYLDNAATSFPKPPAVLTAITDCMKYRGGNPGRGSHALALEAAKEIYACRETAARLFGAEPDRVVFTLNTTHALNVAIKGLLRQYGSPKVHVLCSDMEHNAVYRPLYKLAAEGRIDFDVFPTFPTARVESKKRLGIPCNAEFDLVKRIADNIDKLYDATGRLKGQILLV